MMEPNGRAAPSAAVQWAVVLLIVVGALYLLPVRGLPDTPCGNLAYQTCDWGDRYTDRLLLIGPFAAAAFVCLAIDSWRRRRAGVAVATVAALVVVHLVIQSANALS